MKKILLLSAFIMGALFSEAQGGSWTIILNNKNLIKTGKENESKNVKKIKPSDLNKGWFRIIFKEADPDFWYRSFLFFDEHDNELLRRDSSASIKIQASELRQLFANKKEIHIYTMVAPTDPSYAVRVRRVHLLTLRL